MEARQVVSPFLLSATGGDLFELEPVNPYSDSDLDWTDENSRVVKEHDNPNERNVALVAATVDNWEKYDTVWIGYPIWWGIAAWPVNGFVGQMILQEKRLFLLHLLNSGLGESGELLKQTAGTGTWLEGKRFSSGASEAEIREWVEALGL